MKRPHQSEESEAFRREAIENRRSERSRASASDDQCELPRQESTEHQQASQPDCDHGTRVQPGPDPRRWPQQQTQAGDRQQRSNRVGPHRVRFFESARNARAPMNPSTTIGTFTRKIDPHQNLDSSSPPAIGPMAMRVPRFRPRSRCPSPLARVAEEIVDDRQRGRDGEGGTGSHDGSARDQRIH